MPLQRTVILEYSPPNGRPQNQQKYVGSLYVFAYTPGELSYTPTPKTRLKKRKKNIIKFIYCVKLIYNPVSPRKEFCSRNLFDL